MPKCRNSSELMPSFFGRVFCFSLSLLASTARADVIIADNPSLIDIDGLSGVTSLASLQVVNNDQLINLDGVVNVGTISDVLYVRNNNQLANCEALAPILGWPDGPPDDKISGAISIYANAGGCSSVGQILDSVIGPSQPVITGHSNDLTKLSLFFDGSSAPEDFFPVTGYRAACRGAEVDIGRSPNQPLRDNVVVRDTINVSGLSGTGTQSFISEIEVDIDITHSDPTDLYITLTTPEGTELVLWDRGSPGSEDLVGTFPTSLSPLDSLESVASEAKSGAWTLRVQDVDVGPIPREGVLNAWGLRISEQGTFVGGVTSPFRVEGAGVGGTYTCTLAPISKLGVQPESAAYVATLNNVPLKPVVLATDYEDGAIVLRVSVGDDGGSTVTGYTATCTDGTNTYTGTSTSSPITVSGLTNDVAYTCTVTATNSVGTSSASAATDPITPEEMSAGLPIWLLYQATQ